MAITEPQITPSILMLIKMRTQTAGLLHYFCPYDKVTTFTIERVCVFLRVCVVESSIHTAMHRVAADVYLRSQWDPVPSD